MYTFFKRTLPHPNLVEFDCPDGISAMVRRERSNTPLQALVTLNNEVFFDAARALAVRVRKAQLPSDAARIDYAWQLCLARHPDDFELARIQTLLQTFRGSYQSSPQAAAELTGSSAGSLPPAETAAWIAVANVLMNLDEFVTRN
jgi:hypothetical protein